MISSLSSRCCCRFFSSLSLLSQHQHCQSLRLPFQQQLLLTHSFTSNNNNSNNQNSTNATIQTDKSPKNRHDQNIEWSENYKPNEVPGSNTKDAHSNKVS